MDYSGRDRQSAPLLCSFIWTKTAQILSLALRPWGSLEKCAVRNELMTLPAYASHDLPPDQQEKGRFLS